VQATRRDPKPVEFELDLQDSSLHSSEEQTDGQGTITAMAPTTQHCPMRRHLRKTATSKCGQKHLYGDHPSGTSP